MSKPKPPRGSAKRRQDTDETLAALAHLLPDLDDDLPALRHRGPRGRGVLTDQEVQRQIADWKERKATAVWLEQRGLIPSGPRSVPVDFTARELRAQITAEIIELENKVASQMVGRPEISPSRTLRIVRSLADGDQLDDITRIQRLRTMLSKLHLTKLEEEVAARSAEILNLARTAIDPPNLGQLGRCPWCSAKTLEVDYQQETITCINKACRNPPHVWRGPEWKALAQLCAAAEAARQETIEP